MRTKLQGTKVANLFQFRIQTLLLLLLIFAILGAWWRDRQQLLQQIAMLESMGGQWSTVEATGSPNTQAAGDFSTAWASKTPDGQREWLVLEYDEPVIPKSVVIHETYNPGAVDRVSILTDFGTEVPAWAGVDPTPTTAAWGVSNIKLNTKKPVSQIKIYIDSPKVPGWNEIDAVGLVDSKGNTHWASKAYSSSSFGRNTPMPSKWEKLLSSP